MFLGGVGSALRYGVGRAALAFFGPNFPAGTLIVNVVGATGTAAFYVLASLVLSVGGLFAGMARLRAA